MKLLAAIALALTVIAPAAAEAPLSASDAATFIAAYNASDHAALQTFFASRMSTGALAQESAQAMAQRFVTMRSQSGTLTPGTLSFVDTGDLEGIVHPQHGHAAKIVLLASRRQPTKISDLFFFPQIDPAIVQRLPTRAVAQAEVAPAISRYFTSLERDGLFSGTVLITRGNTTVFQGAYNVANRTTHAPNTLATLFDVASMGKMFTAISIAQLIEHHKLRFDETLAQALPDYPNQDVARRITIQQLLSHTSGLPDLFDPDAIHHHPGPWKTLRDLFPIFASEPLVAPPGTQFAYSNAGYVVLGAIIERASGEEFTHYLQHNIFAPAAISGALYNPAPNAPGVSMGYSFADDPFRLNAPVSNDQFFQQLGVAGMPSYPAGGEYLSAADVDRFFQTLRSGRYISAAMLQRLMTPMPGTDVGNGRGYALGFESFPINGITVMGHNGGGVGSGIDCTGGIQGDLTVTVLTNGDPPTGMDAFTALWHFLLKEFRE